MSTGPVSGNGIIVTVPPGSMIFWSAVAQAAFIQNIVLNDATGTAVFKASGQSSDGHSPTQFGQGMFQADPNGTGVYTLYIGSGSGTWQQVIWDEAILSQSGNNYFSQLIYVSEDGADQDFNDTCLTLGWFKYLG